VTKLKGTCARLRMGRTLAVVLAGALASGGCLVAAPGIATASPLRAGVTPTALKAGATASPLKTGATATAVNAGVLIRAY